MLPGDPRIHAMMKVLAERISHAFAHDPEIQEILREMEEAGFRVDIFLASVAWTTRRPEDDPSWNTPPSFNAFDRAFLRALRIRLDEDSPNPQSQD